tara:strand:- start:33 stop:443 length:411 start_codon:yes stop_codon:yes gene_type:complete
MSDKKKIKALEKQVAELKQSLDKILNTLEGDKFPEDWALYQKWTKLKDKLPTLRIHIFLQQLKIQMETLRLRANYLKKDPGNMIYFEQENTCLNVVQKIEKETKTLGLDSKELLLWYGLSTSEIEKIMDAVYKNKK